MHDLATPLPGQPHDLRHGVAMEILEAQHDLEAVRAMLKRAVEFYEAKALDALAT